MASDPTPKVTLAPPREEQGLGTGQGGPSDDDGTLGQHKTSSPGLNAATERLCDAAQGERPRVETAFADRGSRRHLQ